MTFPASRFKSFYISLCCLAFTIAPDITSAQTKKDCLQQAKTALEELYCEVKGQGEGATLPSLSDFRRNTQEVQALLLKRPAQKLRLKIPAITTAPQPTTPQAVKSTEPAHTKATAKTEKRTSSAEKTAASQPPRYSALAGCQLRQQLINCSSKRFTLITNQPNDQLPASALAEDNKLELPGWDPSVWSSEQDYLEDAYRIYIDKMIGIGLGAATMSFSRFHNHYYNLKKQQVNFRQRFATMFDYLKSDKQKMLVPAQLSDELPASIDACNYLRPNLITCDDGFNNWLYLAGD